MTPLSAVILEEVRRRGRVSFAEYMRWALYHPQGYYMTARRIGRGGDFFTSAQTGRLFGRLLLETFLEMWEKLGSGHFSLVELGGNDGTLAESLLRAFEESGDKRPLRYYLIEASPWARGAARRRLSRFPRVSILDSLESFEHTNGVEGCVFSNEFFDALPFHRVAREGGRFLELWVAAEAGLLVEKPGEVSHPGLSDPWREKDLPEGHKAEVCLLFGPTLSEISRVLSRGFVLTVDYGGASEDLYNELRPQGTLRSYHRHRLQGPFQNIGEADITAHVDFSRLASLGEAYDLRPLLYTSQGNFLLHSGEKVLRQAIEGNMSSAAEVQQLIHPQNLGGRFQVLVQGKNVGAPALSGGKINRLRRLGVGDPAPGMLA